MDVDRCATCQGIISTSDESFHWGELLVCRTCYAGLASNQPEPALARPVQFGALTIGPDVLTVGSVMLPIRNVASVQSAYVEDSQENSVAVGFWIIVGFFAGLFGVTCLPLAFTRDPNNGQYDGRLMLIMLLLGFGCIALAITAAVKILNQLGRKTRTLAIVVTATSGQQVRIDFTNQRVMQHALSVLRQAVAAAHGSTTFNTLNAVIVNQPEIQRRTS